MTKPSTPPSLSSKSESLINLSDSEKSEIKTKISQGIVDEALLKEYSEKGFKISQEVLTKIRLEALNTQAGMNSKKIEGLSQIVNNTLPHEIQGNEGRTVSAVSIAVFNKDGEKESGFVSGNLDPRGLEKIDTETCFAVGSVTKMFTSATLLKLCDEELTIKKEAQSKSGVELVDNFPQGIDTHLSHFMDRLKERNPECQYLKEIEKSPHYEKVTLRDLLNHTHALGARNDRDIAIAQLEDPQKRFTPAEILDYSKLDPQAEYGKFKYGNLGTELSAMVIELVTDKPFDKAIDDTLIKPLGLDKTQIKREASPTNFAQGVGYIREFSEGEKNYGGVEMDFNTSGNSVGAGGIITNPKDCAKFMQSFLSTSTENSLFKNQETIDALYRDKDSSQPHQICGIKKFDDGTLGHNGDNGNSEASARFDPETKKVFISMMATENLTSIIATEQLLKESGYKELSDKEKENKIQIRVGELIDAGYDFKKIDSEIKSGKEIAKIAEESKEKIEGIRKGHSVDTKFKALSALERVDEHSSYEGRNTPFPIASISKTFCGAVCALMAVDGEFGANGIDTTLNELLENALKKYPDREEKIIKYKELLENKGFSDVKISELLNHRSGCRDNDELAPSSWKDKTPLEFFSNNLGRGQCKRGDYNYSNNGYVLLEEIINLTSPQGSYIKEVENRIIKPLKLENTGSLEDHNNPKSEVAKTHLAQAVFIPGAKVNPHSENVYQERTEFPANHTTPLGPVSNSCGGLYSSIDDLKKFSQELVKMFTGQSNSLTDKPEDVSKVYHDQLPEELSDSKHCSLGVDVSRGFDKEGQPIFDKEGQPIFVLEKTGLFPGNFASMKVPTSHDDSLEPKIGIFFQKFDNMVTEHFTEKADKIQEKMIKEFLNPLLNEEEKVEFAGKKSEDVEKYLIDNGRLPKDFENTHEEIHKTFNLAREEVKTYLKQKYLTVEGVIDSEKLLQNFKSTEDVDKVVSPMFSDKIEIAKGILAKSKEKIGEMKKGQEKSSNDSPSSSPRASGVASQVAPPLNVQAKTTT